MSEKEMKTPSPNKTYLDNLNAKSGTKLKTSSISIDELEKINEQNIKLYNQRNKRNRIIIITLTILLILSISAMIIFGVITKKDLNCFMHVRGEAEAVYFVDNKEINKFRTPSNMRGYCILEFDLKIKIESGDSYIITFEAVAYQNDTKLDNLLIYLPNSELFTKISANKYQSNQPILGYQTIGLCKGVIIDKKYENTLNVDNFKLDFTTTFEKV